MPVKYRTYLFPLLAGMTLSAGVLLPFTGCDRKRPTEATAKPKSEKKPPGTAKANTPTDDPADWDIVDPRHESPHQQADIPAPKLARNKQPHPPFIKAHQEFVEIAKAGNVDLLFLGDSITAKWREFPDLWKKEFGDYKAANFGIGGDRTQHLLWRIVNGELDGIHPKVAVVMIGTNNLGTDSAKDVASGVSRIVHFIIEKSPETKVLLLGILPRGEKPGPDRELIAEANLELVKLQNGKNIVFQDIGERFLKTDGTMIAELMPDFGHPSKEGCQVLAEAIAPRLREWMK